MSLKVIIFLAAFCVLRPVSCFPSNVRVSTQSQRTFSFDLKQTRKTKVSSDEGKTKRCGSCPEPNPDLDLDRREAAFAMLGQLWATSAGAASVLLPKEAKAVYGADANIAIPNVMDTMNKRVNAQCLVENLGNRECLVYLDPAKKIYQGADAVVLIERLEKASGALAQIPSLVSEKKWSKVISVLTGPMGGLGTTMDQLSKLSEKEELLCGLEKIVKKDLYAMAAAAERKNGEQVLKFHEKATQDLVNYSKALS